MVIRFKIAEKLRDHRDTMDSGLQPEAPMISIGQSIEALEKHAVFVRAARQGFLDILDDLRRHSVEITPALLRDHQEVLAALQSRVKALENPEEIAAHRLTLKDELVRYQKSGEQAIHQYRESLDSMAHALEHAAVSLDGGESARLDSIENMTRNFTAVLGSNDLEQIRRKSEELIGKLNVVVKELRRERQLLAAQFQEETRILHKRLHDLENQHTGKAPAVSSPAKPSAAAFSLLAIRIKNWETMVGGFPPEIRIEVYEAFCLELARVFGQLPDIKRCAEGFMMVKLQDSPSEVIKLVDKLTATILEHEVMVRGQLHRLRYRISTGLVHASENEAPDNVMARFSQLAQALQS